MKDLSAAWIWLSAGVLGSHDRTFKSVELKQRCAERSDEVQTYCEMKGSGRWLLWVETFWKVTYIRFYTWLRWNVCILVKAKCDKGNRLNNWIMEQMSTQETKASVLCGAMTTLIELRSNTNRKCHINIMLSLNSAILLHLLLLLCWLIGTRLDQ